MFTRQEAVTFLQQSWGIERVEERVDGSSRKDLLEEVLTTVQSKIPFQSITLMSVPPAERVRPSMETIKNECMQGIGGLCYNLNVFTWGLLQGLGYSVHLCPATCTSTVTSPNNHVIVLVDDLEKKGDLHLVECGLGFPTFRAVSLNFEEESPVYVDSFLEYKYIRRDGKFLRMHGDGDMIKRNDPPIEGLDFIVDKWRRFYFFSVQPTDSLSDFDEVFDKVFTMPKTTPFDHSPRALCFSGKKTTVLVNNRLMLEQEDRQLQTTVLQNDDEIVESYRHYFPQLKTELVRRALDQWHSLQK